MLRGGRSVTASLAYSAVRLTDVSIDDLLAAAKSSGGPPQCGHVRGDRSADEETVVEDRPREPVLKQVGTEGPRIFNFVP